MALSKTSLKNRIIAELDLLGFDTTESKAKNKEFAEAVANAIVDEFTTNARCSGVDSNGNTHNNVQIV